MVFDEDENSTKKTQEYRNLAEFAGLNEQEIFWLDQNSNKEYRQIYAEYQAWCLAMFNKSCNEFNEKQKAKMQNYSKASANNTDDGLTA